MIPEIPVTPGNARRAAGVFFLCAGLGGCALIIPQAESLRQAWPADLPARVELEDVPFYPQKDYQCGPAALATTLVHLGVKVTPEDLVERVYLPARRGSLQVEMLAAPRSYGLVSYQLARRFEDVLREVAAGIPVIVLQDYGIWPFSVWHYAVVIGYDRSRSELMLRSGERRRLVMPFAALEYTWKPSHYWAMVAVPPGRLPATATESGYIAAVTAMERVASGAAAATAYGAFLQRWPDNLAASIGLANSLYAQGKRNEAATVLRRAADRHPDSVPVLNNLAQTLSDLDRHDEALAVIERAVALGGPFAAAARETYELILRRMKAGH